MSFNHAYNAIDIANYIIWRAEVMGIKDVTHLKLQKLLYYVAAKYAQDHFTPLINEDIVKWQYGPVVKSVYHQFKLFRDRPLSPTSYLSENSNYSGVGNFVIEFTNPKHISMGIDLDAKVRNSVEYVLEKIGNYSAFELVDRTHREPAWRDFMYEILSGSNLPYSLGELMVADI